MLENLFPDQQLGKRYVVTEGNSPLKMCYFFLFHIFIDK